MELFFRTLVYGEIVFSKVIIRIFIKNKNFYSPESLNRARNTTRRGSEYQASGQNSNRDKLIPKIKAIIILAKCDAREREEAGDKTLSRSRDNETWRRRSRTPRTFALVY